MRNLDSVSYDITSKSDAYMLARSKHNTRKSEKTMDRYISLLEDFDSKDNKLSRSLEIPALYLYTLKAIYSEFAEVKGKQRQLHKVFKIPKKEITGDLTTLINSDGNFKAYVNDFQYDITTPKKAIKNIEIFWGNLYLEKLHDFSKLESLKLVIGDVYTTTGKNIEWLSNIKAITGDIYASDNAIIEQFKDILYVGGSIYNTRNGDVVKTYKR